MVRLFVESVPPVYLCCDTLLTAADIASAVRFQNEARRNEHLAWRRIVRRELGRSVAIEYNEVGAPVVDSANTCISVAHSRERVAVAIADERVGIDIERIDRDFGRAAERFASSSEISLGEGDGAWLAKLWTAKEAMYKYYGVRGVDLRDELRITAIDAARGVLRGELRGKEAVEEAVEVSFKLYDNRYIVATAVAAK
jgi:phosphopantetheinyl transferase